MARTAISTKGQLIIPKRIRDRRGWTPGTPIEVEERDAVVVLRPVADLPETTLDDLLGCAGYSGPARTMKEMEAAIARGARGRR